MIFFSIVGGVILVFFLFMGFVAGVASGEDGASPMSVVGLLLIVALSGFLIAAGLLG